MTNAEVLSQVEHGYRMPMPPNCTAALYDIMLECWHKDPMRRPTFETLQWKLEDFFTLDQSDYREAQPYWLTNDDATQFGTVPKQLTATSGGAAEKRKNKKKT